MKLQTQSVTGCLCLLLIMTAMVSCSHTKNVSTEEPLTGEKIFDSFIEASGGIDNYDNIINRYSEATLTIPAAGIDLDLKIYNARPNRLYSIASSDAIGEIRRGTDGAVFWENSLMSGPRLLEGEELSAALREATFDRFEHWRNYYKRADYIGRDSIDGLPVYKVTMVPAEGEPETYYFDAATGLMVRVESIYKSEMGELPLAVNMDDYRTIDGIRMPYKSTITVMGQERQLVVNSIRHNVDMPDSLFAIPPDIQELMGQ